VDFRRDVALSRARGICDIRHVRPLVMLAIVAVVLGACSSFSEEQAGSASGAPDGGADATSAEGSAPREGGSTGPCASRFCASFDADPFDGEWSGYEKAPYQQVQVGLAPTEDAPRSTRRALRLTIPTSTKLYESNYLKKRVMLPAHARSLTYRYAIRLQQKNTKGGTVRVAALAWVNDVQSNQTVWSRSYLVGDELTQTIAQESKTLETTVTRRLDIGRWYEMATTITFNSPQSATVECFVDGVSYDQKSFDPLYLPEGNAEIRLGGDYAASDWSPTTVDFDDVSFDAQ
jgi:hypothetical protein